LSRDEFAIDVYTKEKVAK